MVGASILNVITESLYDNPIVVFREYVQNSVDAIYQTEDHQSKQINIWIKDDNLFFLDNGTGIDQLEFEKKMTSIGASSKSKRYDLGYKGIGRLSGVPYCQNIYFINICKYSEKKYQVFKISSNAYAEIKKTKDYEQFDFETLMKKIGTFSEGLQGDDYSIISEAIEAHSSMFDKCEAGFLVVLNGMRKVLNDIVDDKNFTEKLSWLLPVDFQDQLKTSEISELLLELKEKNKPFRACSIFYNGEAIKRPIENSMLRDHSCLNDFECAQGFYSFNGSKIEIDNANSFSGIRMYIDNMLLCDETELIQNLANYHLLSHSINGSLQAVRGIGVMIYISDKINISANARRTFIEVSDQTSFEFLRKVSEFIDMIYDARYALSNYVSSKRKEESKEKVELYKQKALESLRELAKDNVELTHDDETDFNSLSEIEKKRIVKKIISSKMENQIKEYVKCLQNVEKEDAYDKFTLWLIGKGK